MEYSTVNFKAQKDAIYNDSLVAGATTRASHRQANENVADSAVMLDDLAPVTASGTDTYTATLLKDPGAAYANIANRYIAVKFTNANTGAATLNLNSRGALAIKKNGSTALAAGDIPAGSIKLLLYDGTNLQISSSSTDLNANPLQLWPNNDDALGLTLNGNANFFGSTDTGSQNITIGLVNSVAAQTANQISIYAKDSSSGSANATLGLTTEQNVETIGTFTPSHKLRIWINGTEYWIQLDAV